MDTREKLTKNIMGTKPIVPLLLSMSIPPMISMLIQSLYNIVDSIFVAKLGEDAITAISIAYPLQNLVLAVAVGLGVGINACMAMNMGAKNQEAVNLTATNGLVLTAVHSILFVLIGIFLTKPYLQLYTNNEQVLKWSMDYSKIVICFAFGGLFHINIEKMFQSFGNMLIPMLLQGVGAIINIILDPILIYGAFGLPELGVKGAAIATVIGQMSACVLAIILFVKKNKTVTININVYKMNKDIIRKIYSIGIPSGIMMALPSILVSAINGILGNISQTAVAVFGLYYKIQSFVYMPSNGIVQGMRPIVSYNYGAKSYDRLKSIVKISLLAVMIIMGMGTVLFISVPEWILHMFSATDEMNHMGINAFRIISVGFIVSSIGFIFSGVFEAMGKGRESLIISMLRQIIIVLPLSYLLGNLMGIEGVWLAFPIAEIIASLVAVVFMKKTFRSFKSQGNYLNK
jgi:putative MATE family efflux protein